MHMPDILSSATSVEFSKGVASILSFVFLFIGASVAVGFIFGRNKLVNIFINIYIAFAFVSALPPTVFATSPYAEAGLFFVLLVFLTSIDQHLFDLHIPNASYDIFWRLFIMSFLVVGMVTSAMVTLLPAKTVLSLPFPFLSDYFGTPTAFILWLSLPLLVLIFMNKRLR